MPKAGRRRAGAVAISAGLHAGLFIALALHAPRLKVPPPASAGPPAPIIPILLSPRAAASAAAAGGGPIRLHRRQVRPRDLPAHVRPLETAAAAAPRPAPTATSPTPNPGEAGAGPPALASADLSRALRGRLGCANLDSLSRAERAACEERLGRGAADAPYIPAPIDPAKRAYYAAVAAAKAPDPPPTPQGATGRLGLFEGDARGMKGHGPQVGCSIKFGPGEKPKGPPNALKLGPCFINPPAGPLSPDVDIAPP